MKTSATLNDRPVREPPPTANTRWLDKRTTPGLWRFSDKLPRASPAVCSRVINFCAAQYDPLTHAAYHQNASIRERGSAVALAGRKKRSRRVPRAGCRIKDFRTGNKGLMLTVAARDNDSPIAKHRSGMRPAAIDKIAGQAPNSGDRVINLRCRESAREIHGPAHYKYSSVGKQSLGVVRTRSFMLPVALHVPVAGS